MAARPNIESDWIGVSYFYLFDKDKFFSSVVNQRRLAQFESSNCIIISDNERRPGKKDNAKNVKHYDL